MKVLKTWSKSEILLRIAVMKIFNFSQNFDSTSNFQISFKWTREHSMLPFWDLHFIYKSEMKVLKTWSKSEISLRTAVIKNFQFFTKFWLNLKLPKILLIDIRTLYNDILRLAIHSQVWNESLEKLVKIWNFAKDRGHQNFQFFTKFWPDLKLPEILHFYIRTL